MKNFIRKRVLILLPIIFFFMTSLFAGSGGIFALTLCRHTDGARVSHFIYDKFFLYIFHDWHDHSELGEPDNKPECDDPSQSGDHIPFSFNSAAFQLPSSIFLGAAHFVQTQSSLTTSALQSAQAVYGLFSRPPSAAYLPNAIMATLRTIVLLN